MSHQSTNYSIPTHRWLLSGLHIDLLVRKSASSIRDKAIKKKMILLSAFWGFLVSDRYGVETFDNVVCTDNIYLALFTAIRNARSKQRTLIELKPAEKNTTFPVHHIKECFLSQVNDDERSQYQHLDTKDQLLNAIAAYAASMRDENDAPYILLIDNIDIYFPGLSVSELEVITTSRRPARSVHNKQSDSAQRLMHKLCLPMPRHKNESGSNPLVFILARRVVVFGKPSRNINLVNKDHFVFIDTGI